VQTLVYGGQAAFDAIVQTLEAHYACTDNAARTDNSLEISHLHNTEHFELRCSVYIGVCSIVCTADFNVHKKGHIVVKPKNTNAVMPELKNYD